MPGPFRPGAVPGAGAGCFDPENGLSLIALEVQAVFEFLHMYNQVSIPTNAPCLLISSRRVPSEPGQRLSSDECPMQSCETRPTRLQLSSESYRQAFKVPVNRSDQTKPTSTRLKVSPPRAMKLQPLPLLCRSRMHMPSHPGDFSSNTKASERKL